MLATALRSFTASAARRSSALAPSSALFGAHSSLFSTETPAVAAAADVEQPKRTKLKIPTKRCGSLAFAYSCYL